MSSDNKEASAQDKRERALRLVAEAVRVLKDVGYSNKEVEVKMHSYTIFGLEKVEPEW